MYIFGGFSGEIYLNDLLQYDCGKERSSIIIIIVDTILIDIVTNDMFVSWNFTMIDLD
jgi:hypothetical protein